MTWVDVTLTPEAGYTYVHHGQIYNAIATALSAHPSWQYVDLVTVPNGGYSYYRYVWRCKAAGSGLPSDFYVVFQVMAMFTPALSWLTNSGIRIYLGETYVPYGGGDVGGELGMCATNNSTIQVMPKPGTLHNPTPFFLWRDWDPPGSIFQRQYAHVTGTNTEVTSLRYLALIAKDSIILSNVGRAGSAPSSAYIMYIGAYESTLSSTDDPMPLVLMGNTTTQNSSNVGGAFTRAALATPDVYVAGNFCAATSFGGKPTNSSASTVGYQYMTPPTGTLGTAGTNYWKNLGPTVSRCPVNTWHATDLDAGTKGIFRGYLKNVVCGYITGTPYGNTYRVDGKVYAGIAFASGGSPLINTEAT